MKKFLLTSLIIIIISGLFIQPCFAVEENQLEPISEIQYKGVPGTVPRDGAVNLFSVSPEDVSVSTQIYRNISRFGPKAYMRTDEGLCVVNPWGEMSSYELSWVREKSEEILEGKTTADEKIRAVAEYVAKNVGYDYDYYYHRTKTYEQLNHTAYDVLTNGGAVCYGYAAAVYVLLQAADIPCLMITSPNHAWNMAYNGERWVLFDTTWMSCSIFEYNELKKSDRLIETWYDFSIEKANSNANHLLTGADYSEYNNGIYEFPVYSKTIQSFTVPYWITTVGEFAFNKCSIPLSCHARLINVETAAFQGCKNLTGVIDLTRAESVGEYAFYNCEKISGLILGDKLKSIYDATFVSCKGCREVVLPKTITYISSSAFVGASGVQKVYYSGTSAEWNAKPVNSLKSATKVFNFKPAISVNKLKSGEYQVNYNSILAGEKLIVAEYLDGQMVDMQFLPIQKTVNVTTKSSNSDEIKFMVFDGYVSAYPKVICVSVNN